MVKTNVSDDDYFLTKLGGDYLNRVPFILTYNNSYNRCIVAYSGEWNWAELEHDNENRDCARNNLLSVSNNLSKVIAILNEHGDITKVIEENEKQMKNNFTKSNNNNIKDVFDLLFSDRCQYSIEKKYCIPLNSGAGIRLSEKLRKTPKWGLEIFFFEFKKRQAGEVLVVIDDYLIRHIIMPMSADNTCSEILEASMYRSEKDPSFDLNSDECKKVITVTLGLIGRHDNLK